MGFLRFILACAVIIEHTSPVFGLKLTGGMIAVEAFFMISGFYMALILNQKYTGAGSYSLFITNRFLKLFPIYWIVLAGVMLFGACSHLLHGNLGALSIFGEYSLHWSSALYLIATNALIFGQDLALFLKFTPDMALIFTTDFRASDPMVYRFLLIPPAWSLGLELMFYLMAPFLVRRSAGFLTILMAGSLVLRFIMTVKMGLDHDPWLYRFFPLEIAFFLAGSLAFKAYSAIPWKRIPVALMRGIFGGILVFTVAFDEIELSQWLFYGCFAAAIPFVFRLTKDSALDRQVGDLSYPMYVSHLLVFWTLSSTQVFDKVGTDYRGLLTILCTVAISMGLLRASNPIERIRTRRVSYLPTVNAS